MTHTKWVYFTGMLTAAIALLLAYGLGKFWLGAITAPGLGFLGWFGLKRRKWNWSNDLFLVGAVIMVIIGGLLGLRLSLLLPALLGTLTAWDLARFQQRLENVPVTEAVLKIEKRHLSLLALALVSGGTFVLVIQNFQVQLSFGLTLALSVILVISLGQIYRLLQD